MSGRNIGSKVVRVRFILDIKRTILGSVIRMADFDIVSDIHGVD